MSGFFSIVWVIFIIVAVGAGIGKSKKRQSTWKSVGSAPAQSAPAAPPKPAPKCGNSEPHLHRETVPEGGPELCENGEPHRHFSSAPPLEVYHAPSVDSADQVKHRLHNMKDLYDAGLLTYEEYAEEVRKVRRG